MKGEGGVYKKHGGATECVQLNGDKVHQKRHFGVLPVAADIVANAQSSQEVNFLLPCTLGNRGPSVSKVWCLFFLHPPGSARRWGDFEFCTPSFPPWGVSEVPSFDFRTPLPPPWGVSEVPSFEFCTSTVQNRWHPLNFAPNELLHVNKRGLVL